MSRRKTDTDVFRMALHYAIQDRDGMADADPGEHGQRAKEQAAMFREVLFRRFGERTWQDSISGESVAVFPPQR